MTLKEIYQAYLDASPKAQVAEAIEASNVVLKYLYSNLSDKDASSIYLMLIATYVGADGNVSASEYEFCKAVFGFDFSFDEFFNLVNSVMDEETVEFIDAVIDTAPSEVKSNFVSLGIAICACNGELTVYEQSLLEKYLA